MNDKKQNSLIADVKELLMVWIDDYTSHSIPLSPSLIQSKIVIPLMDLGKVN